jgi:TetR/AcrR family transcriptional repressor of nem operon
LNYRDLAAEVGLKPASFYDHFPSKADIGVAVARRCWEDGAAALEVIVQETPNALDALHRSPEICDPANSKKRARAIFSAVSGAQFIASSRSDILLFDTLIDTYRACGPLPA